jgi:hypothetical protein
VREYARIRTTLWTSSRRFTSLPNDDARLLYLYLHTCQHCNSLGCFVLPIGYATADLGWDADRVRKGIETLSEASLIGFQEAESVVRIAGFLLQDPPTNPKHVQGILRNAEPIPSCEEKLNALKELRETTQGAKVGDVQKAIDTLSHTLSKAYRNPTPPPPPPPGAQQQPSRVDTGRGSSPPSEPDPPAAAAAETSARADAAQPAAGEADGAAHAEPDQDQIQDACRRVQRAVNAATPMANVAPTVRKWLRWGCDLEQDIVPAIEDVMQRRNASGEGPPSKITYFDRPVWDAHQERAAGPPANGHDRQRANGHGDVGSASDPPWRARMQRYRERDIWLDAWGPEPGKRGCQVPADILKEFGYTKSSQREKERSE